MPDILHEVTVAAAPDTVFRAITEQQGLASWWTPDIAAEPTVGATIRARFGGGRYVVAMEVVALEPACNVEWITRQGNAEWIGTHVTWDLTPVERGTRVRFGQRGFASADGALPVASYNWAIYLASLKDYIERGKGNPDFLYADTR